MIRECYSLVSVMRIAMMAMIFSTLVIVECTDQNKQQVTNTLNNNAVL